MKDLLCEVQASVMMEYGRAKKQFGSANNSAHESYAVILEEVEEAEFEGDIVRSYLEGYWEGIKTNNRDMTAEMLEGMRERAEKAAAEWIQVAAMCYKATKQPGGTE